MPAKSRKQQKYLYATKGEAWVKAHHFDKVEGKPVKKKKAKPQKAKTRRTRRG